MNRVIEQPACRRRRRARRALAMAGLALVACSLAAPAAARGSVQRLAAYQESVELAGDGDTVAWSAYDPATRRFRLMLRERGIVREAPVAPRRVRFDVDVGRAVSGGALLVYSRCAKESFTRGRTSGCDLYVFDPARDRERSIPVRPRSADDSRPVVSDGRIVFVRSIGDRNVLYVASVAGGRATRLPLTAMGARDTLYHEGRMDLSGRRVAFVLSRWGGETQVHMQDLDGSHPRRLARFAPGESMSAFVGLNFDANTLGFVRAFFGDWGGPGTAFRFRSDRLEYAPVPRQLTDFALAAGRAFWVNAPEQCFLDDDSDRASCFFVENAGRLAFKPWDRAWGGPW